MRLFAAIDLPDDARAAAAREAARVQADASQAVRDVRWVRPEHLHLTLVFLGEVDEVRVPALDAAMTEPFEQPAFRLGIGGLGVFPPHGAPRVLWSGILQGGVEIGRLRQQVGRRLSGLGFPVDPAPYHAHLTLGRWKRSRPSDRAAVLAADRDRPIAAFEVQSVALVESRLSAGGPDHRIRVQAALGPRTTG